MFTKKLIGMLVVGLALAGKDCGATEAVVLPKDSQFIPLPGNRIKKGSAIKIPSKKKRKPSMPKKKNPNKRKRNQNTSPQIAIDRIIYAISADDGVKYAMSDEEIFNDSTAKRVTNQLEDLMVQVTENIGYYDRESLKRLGKALADEINGLHKIICYAYDELPDYTEEQIEQYRSYYLAIKNKLEEIANIVKE
jgi:hypothetical protein